MKLNDILENRSFHNTSTTTINLLKALKVPLTTSSIIETLEQHPNFPSLLSVSESLTKWNVDHAALKVKVELLEDLPTPFIAHTKKGKGNFVLVNSINGKVEYLNERRGSTYISKEEFIKEWDNVVLLAERNENSGDRYYKVNRRKEVLHNLRIPFIILACLSLTVLFAFSASWSGKFSIIFLLIKLFGSVVTSLLLWFEIDKANPALKQICSSGKKTSCTAVIESKGAKLFNFVSWSEIGFFYFAGGFLFLLLNAVSTTTAFELLCWLNIFALPYIFFSIFYQWKIAKQWCPLCLIVQGLLLTEFIVAFFGYWSSYHTLNLLTIEPILFSTAYMVPLFFWIASKSVYLEALTVKQYKKDLNKMMYNRDIFEEMLTRQKEITVDTTALGITIGNPEAKDTIIKVCNPYCGPCSKAHPEIDELIEQNQNVKVQIIFSGVRDDPDNKTNRVIKHIMALHKIHDARVIKEALDDWYINTKRNYELFAAKYPLDDRLINYQHDNLDTMINWCFATSISFTPTFFFNGFQLPEVYRIEDIKHIL